MGGIGGLDRRGPGWDTNYPLLATSNPVLAQLRKLRNRHGVDQPREEGHAVLEHEHRVGAALKGDSLARIQFIAQSEHGVLRQRRGREGPMGESAVHGANPIMGGP